MEYQVLVKIVRQQIIVPAGASQIDKSNRTHIKLQQMKRKDCS